MPKVTVGTTPTIIYTSAHGVWNRPTLIDFRIDPDDESSTIWVKRIGGQDVTVGGTDDDTDGIPVLAGEVKSGSPLYANESYWAVAAAPVVVYYDISGSK